MRSVAQRKKQRPLQARVEETPHVRRSAQTNWSALQHAIVAALERLDRIPRPVRIAGKLRRLDDGLNHQNYLFRLAREKKSPDAPACGYILRKCRHDGDRVSYKSGITRLQNEASVLEALVSLDLGFAVPEFICFAGAPEAARDSFIETALFGFRVDGLVKTSDKGQFAIDTIARIAAAIHRLPAARFRFLDGHADSTAHVETAVNQLPLKILADAPDATRALRWIEAHAHPRRPAALLHGDLLPQNILWDWKDDQLGVIDWEYAQIGDPAYDLAIVTRGNAKLFGLSGGVKRLVDAYRQAGGIAIAPADVTVHELLLVLNWLGDAMRSERNGKHEGQPPDFYCNQIRSILRRAGAL